MLITNWNELSNIYQALYNGGQIRKTWYFYQNDALRGVKNEKKTGTNTYAVISEFSRSFGLDGNVNDEWNKLNEYKYYTYNSAGQLIGEDNYLGEKGKVGNQHLSAAVYTYDSRG